MAESNEERQARIVAEATAKANAAQREKEEAAAAAKKLADERPVLLYSIFPSAQLCVSSESKELIQMAGTNQYKEIIKTRNHTIAFHGHRAKARAGDLPALRRMHGYGFRFMEGLNANDGDSIACSLESLFDKGDRRAQTFCHKLEENAKRSTAVQVIDEYAIRDELKRLRTNA